MRRKWPFVAVVGILCALPRLAGAQGEATWRDGISQIVLARCAGCHGAGGKDYQDWNLGDKKDAPRMDTYQHFMGYVVWPATGAMMRRLDDGKGAPGGKPGNMYEHLGAGDDERAANLARIKAWLGEGAWNFNRWSARGDVPGITKEQLDKIKAKY